MVSKVLKVPVPDRPNCYIVISGRKRANRYGDNFYVNHQEFKGIEDSEVRSETYLTFVYDAGNACAEWDGCDGPILISVKKNKDDEKAKKHWFYEYADWAGRWSQLAVERECMPHHLIIGDFDYIFNVLKSWAETHNANS